MADEIRLNVINSSIFIEKLISATLATLLDIDLEKSKTLGNKSTSFSLNQKVSLLTDINAFNKNDVRKFQLFSEIRNQFAHNFEIHDFTSCLKLLDGSENYLRNEYYNESFKDLTNEELLENYFNLLFKDILSISHKLLEKVEQKIMNSGRAQAVKEVTEFILSGINKLAQEDETFKRQYLRILDNAIKQFKVENESLISP